MKKRNKKIKNDYKGKIKCRIKNRLSPKVQMFNFSGGLNICLSKYFYPFTSDMYIAYINMFVCV